ncbi:NAD(P)/FAD-dependent oxidoreductase [Actinopolymorpha alba]|uniref:NAD(P)/FAD-dependent oxidoreductase n=1 Tax=Actinopolymorpha alba TaxID=533267 RepID=UPI0004779536|nr:FAD-dependent oxidoreductase [Actinopolymorpha alba]
MERVVVVGAGLAGLRTVTALREQGYSGELILVGAERHPPYDRPPLSKAILLGTADDSALPLDPASLKVDLRLGTRATGLRDGVVETDDGDLAYDGLVIATGSEPIRLPGEGAHYLRTRDDAFALRSVLRPGATVVIVGAGWIGAEVATAAARHGARVTVVEQAATPVAHALPSEVGQRLAPWYAEAGIDLLCGQRVGVVRPDGVELAGGTTLRADVVVVGVGVRPATGWLDGSGLEVDRGVLVGADLRTSLPGVLAVGDAAARWSPRYSTRIRGEHWDDALRAPVVAAANALGGAETYDPVPYVWSEQFGHMVQYAGIPAAGGNLVWRGDPDTDSGWAAFWLAPDGRILSLLVVDQPRDFVQGRRLAEAGTPVDPELLRDPAISVKASVAGSAR